MNYELFSQLINGGQTQNCIMRLECNALQGSIKDDIELIKDIIALSNNENAVNYIIIGATDDGNRLKTLDNPYLTDENLQTFCRENIYPFPNVKLYRLTWDEATEPVHRDKLFIVIQVEAQSKQCFRFNQDFMSQKEQCFYHQGEVWVRHQTSNDFATPEEIKGLFEKKVSNKTQQKVNYAALPYAIALPFILDEIGQLAANLGGKLISDTDPFITRGGPSIYHHVIIPVNEKPLLLRLVPVEKCAENGQIDIYSRVYLTFEHGLLLISLDTISDIAANHSLTAAKENWGWYTTHEFWHQGLKERNLNMPLPADVKLLTGEPSSICFSFANIINIDNLRNAWDSLSLALRNRTELINDIEENRRKINLIISTYLKESCPKATKTAFQPKTLLGNEIWEPEKYGNRLMVKQPGLCEALRSLAEKIDL